jgi:DNA mismatch repair protein MutS2
MTLSEKSLNILELPAVLGLLAGEAVSEAAKEKALDLRPSANRDEVALRLIETTDAKKLMTLKGSPGFLHIKDITGALYRARLGGMLNTRDLLNIADVLRCARTVKAYNGDTGNTSLDGLFSALHANKYLEEKITVSIIGEDEIADAASSELADIRRHIRAANARVRDILQKFITSSVYQKALQEPIITMRSDRYVIPVKAEYKGSVPGLVHDISSSGATLFIEPMQVVSANNEIRELQAKEKKEIERILMELSAEAAGYSEDIALDFSLLTSLDLIFAKAKLSYSLNCSEPEISDRGAAVFRRARHPLIPADEVVPIDISVGNGFNCLVITGPNTGGKTVSIKTLGLLCLMAQCGLHLPCDYGSTVPVFDKILADIGDEQSIEQSLSTFSSHMTNIVGILNEAGENTLLLFDELGAGTDPVEGAALAISIIEYARIRGAFLAVTTHYAELKIYAMTAQGVMNASCEFDIKSLKPTYRLLMGIPGKSNAFDISLRLGLDRGIIEDAKKRLDRGSADFENVLALLQVKRQEMEKDQLEARKLMLEAEANRKKSEELKRYLESERQKAVKTAKREAEQIVQNARKTAEEVFRELGEMRRQAAELENVRQVNEARSEIMRKLNEAESPDVQAEEAVVQDTPQRPVKEGDTVEIIKIGTRAEVISVSPDRILTLQAGIMKITAKENEVRLIEGVQSETRKVIERSEAKLRSMSVSPEVDLRGMTSEEAVSVMEQFLDNAMLAKLNTVTIIHGKGTGALRTAVHNALKRNGSVKSFRLGRFGEGETGVTIVEI